MGSYTKISLEEANEIAELYDLGEIIALKPLSLGISNSNYRIDMHNQSYLLKISNDKGARQLQQEQEILTYLKRRDFGYSLCPFLTKDQRLIYQYKSFFGVIYPFVEGITPGPSDWTCREIGRGIALLHNLDHESEELKKLRSHNEVGYDFKEILDYLKNPLCPQDFQDTFKKVFPDSLETYSQQKFSHGITHGDLYYDNTIFDHNKLAVILDFEQAGRGSLILDLGISISGTCLEKGHLIRPLINSYLQGYEAVRPLPKSERQFLNDAIMLGLFSIALWRIKRFTEGNLNPLMADSYQELLRRALNFKLSLQEIKS